MTGRRLPRSVDWRRVGSAIGLLVIGLVVLVFVATAVPQLVGADDSYVVQSSSMSPSITAGSVVFVSDVAPADLSEGDVITFRTSDGRPRRVTHRVVDIVRADGERRFRTKGDANEEPDPTLVRPAQVIGRVSFHIPLVGYLVEFAGTDLGVVALVVVPAILLAALELRDIYGGGAESPPEVDRDPSSEDSDARGENS